MTESEERSARGRASAAIRMLADPERSPVFAAIGFGDVLRAAASDTVRKVREDLRQRRDDAADTFGLAFGSLPTNVDELIHQLAPAELRKRADHCGRFGMELYEFLTARGEIAVSRAQSEAETVYQQGRLDLGRVGVRLAAAAVDDLRVLASRLADGGSAEPEPFDRVPADAAVPQPGAAAPPATAEAPAAEAPATTPPATTPPATEPPAAAPPATTPSATEPSATTPLATTPSATEPPAR